MDIVTLKTSKRRTSSRRHTTDVTLDQLPRRNSTTPQSSTSSALGVDFYGGDSLSQGSSVFSGGLEFSRSTLTSSWNNLHDEEADDFETSSEISDMPYYMGSQSDVFQELHELELQNHCIHDIQHTHQYQLSYELALDNMLTPFSSHAIPPLPQPTSKSLSHVGHVIQEMVTTERNYVKYLSEIIEGYVIPMETRVGVLSMRESHLVSLFGNINEIRNFNKSLLEALLSCGHDARKVGQCFLDKAEGFKIYSQYCTNYPNSVKVLADLSKDPGVARFLKICQQRLNHMLPLGAFLLKPVQRVLKYSLLLGDMAKHMKRTHDGFEVVHRALKVMTEVAEHINDMKKKYDAAVHIQEIQSLIRGWEEFDLSKYGDLVLEENFRYLSGRSSGPTFRTSRTDRYLFLFQKLCLMTKKEEYGYQYKTHLEMKDIQLTEKIEKDRNCFQIRQVSTGRFFTLQARSVHVKEQWVRTIKHLLMESIPHLPDKAKLLILAGFPTELTEMTRHSPTRHRRQSDEPQRSPQRGGDRSYGRPRGVSKNIGRPIKPAGQDKPPLKSHRQRSHTSPNLPRIRVASPTRLLAQAGLTGYLTATVHTPPDGSRSPEEEEEEDEEEEEIITENDESYLNYGQRDSGFSELFPGNTYDNAHRQRRAGKSPLADTRRSPLREWENRDNPKQNPSPQLKKHKSSTDESNYVRVSPKVSFSSRSAMPEHFDVQCQKQLEQSYSDIPSGSSQIRQSEENYVREVPIRNAKPRGSIRGPAESCQLILPNSSELRINTTAEIDHQLGHIGVSGSTEHLFNRFSELDNESPPLSPVKLTRIDSVGSDEMEAFTQLPSNHLEFTPEVLDPPSMFSADVGEEGPQPDKVRHRSESSVTEEEEDLFNELMKSNSELPCLQSDDLEDAYDPLGSSLSRNDEDISNSASPVDEQTIWKPSEELELHSSPLEGVHNVETATPKASPFVTHRGTVKSHVSQLSPDSDDLQVTPTASPHVSKRVTSCKGVHSSGSSVEEVSSIIEPPFEFKCGKMLLESNSGKESPVLPIPPDFDDEMHPIIRNVEPFLAIPKTAVVRRHSFGSRTRNMFNRKRDGSHSYGNSPNESPAMQPGKKVTKIPQKSSTMSVLRRHHSDVYRSKKRPISILGLISTTRSDISLEDLPSVCSYPDTDVLVASDTILPPPEQFEEPLSVPEQQNEASSSGRRKYDSLYKNSPEESQSQSGSVQPSTPKEKRRSTDYSSKTVLWFQRHRKTTKRSQSSSEVITPNEKVNHLQTQVREPPPVLVPEVREKSSKEPITVIPPYDDNPEESLSFDEILASFDQYASATGDTTKKRSRGREKMRVPSPDPQHRNKTHKRRKPRFLTISSIDADTMKAVEEALQENKEPPPPPPRPKTKVHQMAREYSRRIKDHQRRGIFRRYSTVVEEPPELSSESPSVKKGPIWLDNLKEMKRSRTLSQSSQDETLSPLPERVKHDLAPTPSDSQKTISPSPYRSRDNKHASYSRVQVEVTPQLRMLDTPGDSSHHSSKSMAQSHTRLPPSNMHPGAHSKVKFDEAEFHRKGGFRGWVKSLVDKFSGSSKDRK